MPDPVYLQCDRCGSIMLKERLEHDEECLLPAQSGVRFRHPDALVETEEPPEFEYRCPDCNTVVSFSVIEEPCKHCLSHDQNLCDGLQAEDSCTDRIATDDGDA